MYEVPESYLREDGLLNELGVTMVAAFLDKLDPCCHGEAFIPLRRHVVSVAIELVIISQDTVLMTYRDDQYFKGWHFPGTYQTPGETWTETADRCALRELGVRVVITRPLEPCDNPENPRFHDLSLLLLCRTRGDVRERFPVGSPEPGDIRRFFKCPENIIPGHQKIWKVVEKEL